MWKKTMVALVAVLFITACGTADDEPTPEVPNNEDMAPDDDMNDEEQDPIENEEMNNQGLDQNNNKDEETPTEQMGDQMDDQMNLPDENNGDKNMEQEDGTNLEDNKK